MFSRVSLLALLAANLVPLIGVLFFAWDLILVLALFWIENIIIGIFNLLKMLAVAARTRQINGVFLSVFFVLHYGLFCSAHGQLLSKLLGVAPLVLDASAQATQTGPFNLFIDAANLCLYFIDSYSPVILLAILGLVLSHLVSLIENFILKGGMFNQSVNKLMGKPYKQILIMHAGLMLGAIALQKFGSSIWLLAVLVGLKMVVDFRLHKRRHKPASPELIKDL